MTTHTKINVSKVTLNRQQGKNPRLHIVSTSLFHGLQEICGVGLPVVYLRPPLLVDVEPFSCLNHAEKTDIVPSKDEAGRSRPNVSKKTLGVTLSQHGVRVENPTARDFSNDLLSNYVLASPSPLGWIKPSFNHKKRFPWNPVQTLLLVYIDQA